MDIGFIGLGNMGAPMALNLARNGFNVTGYDISGRCPGEVGAAGSAAEAASARDIVITMLPDGEALLSVVSEILPVMRKGSILLDCTTADLESTMAASARVRNLGLEFVDAPVSGGVNGASAGTLTIMAGGSEDAFERSRPALDAMGRRVVHCGGIGTGQTAKMCNNMILGASMIATCEAFVMAERLGLEARTLHEVVSSSSGYSWVSNAYTPVPGVGQESPADDGYRAGFSASLMLKDLRLAQAAADSVSASTPMGRLAEEFYTELVEADGMGQMDFSSVILKLSGRKESTD